MATREDPPSALSTPQRHINFVPAAAGDTFMLGPIKVRIMEDGSRTGINFESSSESFANTRNARQPFGRC